ncbi:MAG: 3-hydroxyacyl-[acyl-carrier-protein] dehydratase FabZ [Acidobacteria bacterium]|nr:MAG: 3-hydroxyacyl-[acyl-carrier-protein] dehydratase FabZ [Acidobacteriota bacterium]
MAASACIDVRHYYVDRVLDLRLGEAARGVKCVSLSEDVFNDHFPGNPVLPGVYLVEGMAQTAGILLERTTGGKRVALMVSIDRARFLGFARPGDQVQFEVTVESLQDDACRVMASAKIADRTIASARLSFSLVERGRLIPPGYEAYWEHTLATWRGEYLDLKDD